jgi:hypothetical protein
MGVSSGTFEREVIERSAEIPVVLTSGQPGAGPAACSVPCSSTR